MQKSEDAKLLIDILDLYQTRRICSACLPSLLQHILKNFEHSKPEEKKTNTDEDYQLALAMSLSQREAEEKTKQKRKFEEDPIDVKEEKDVLLKISEAIEKFLNRAKSNCK